MDQFKRDVQKEKPRLVVGLNRVGVKNIQKIIRIKNNEKENLFYSTIDIFVDLLPQQKGAHMSRFDETITQIIDETIQKKVMVIEDFATYMAEMARKRQHAHRAEVRIKAKYPVEEMAPVSKKKTQKINTIMGRAVSTKNGSRHLVGVETNGMTVCPCAQQMIKEYAEEKLEKEGFTKEQLEKVFKYIPMPSHNQEIVRKAHLNPRFVEDVVREMVALTIKEFDFLSDDDYFLAKQTNYEGIHSYEVYAERSGTIGEIKKEIEKAENDYINEDYIVSCNNTSTEEWLDSDGGC